jgi:Squalene-hopene cyclase C-terminal domain
VTIAKLLLAPLTYRLWRPAHLALILRDLLRPTSAPPQDRRAHLAGAIDWLCRAQDRRDGEADAGGVSAGWSFEDGWLPSYPETSGYIVETLLAAAAVLGRPELITRAARILDWELAIQLPDGSFPGHFGEAGSRPVIFNTGQIMHGLLAGHLELGRPECLQAALRAGRWLAASQDPDGCWRRNVHNGIPHVYNTRAAWALLRTGIAADDPGLRDAAAANLRWALSRQTDSGWLQDNAFITGVAPFTHTIAYAIRGILECALLLGDQHALERAELAAGALARQQRADGWLAGTFADGWVPRADYCCLTGLAQCVLVWQRLQHAGGHGHYSGNIRRGLDYLQRNHWLLGDGSPQDGGIAGSQPIWGAYSRFEYPNWAAKFFADALLMDLADIRVPASPAKEAR